MEIYKDNLIPTLTWEEVVTPPQNTLVNQRIIGGSMTGTSFISNTDNARVEIFPENNQEVGLQVLNASGENVFGAYIAGNSAGDVSIGNYAGNQGILWDNSTGKLNVKGEIVVTGDITSANYSAVVPYAGYKLEYATGYGYFHNVYINNRLGSTIAGAIDEYGHFIDDRLDTSAKTILDGFTFGASGALQIGTYEAGVSGDVKISPAGIVGRDKTNKTTFTIDGTTGDASFAGSLSAPTGTLGALTIATGGNIKLGQTAYNTGTGFWLGDDMGTTKFSLGNPAGDYITWDGTEIDTTGLNINTRFVAGETIATGDIVCIKNSYIDYTSSESVYVNGNPGYADLNFVSDDYINVGDGGLKIGFIKFDTTTIGYIPSSEFILRAELILTSRQTIPSTHIEFFDIGTSWDEDTITYNTMPAGTPYPIEIFNDVIVAPYAGIEIKKDITQTVRRWKKGGVGVGIMISIDDNAMFFSNRGATPSFRPKLRIYSSYSSDGKVYKANSGDYLTSRSIVGVALEDKNIDENIKVQVGGIVKDITTSNPGGKIYLSTVSGGISESSSGLSNIISLGDILDSNKILWNKDVSMNLIESTPIFSISGATTRTVYVPDDAKNIEISVLDASVSPSKSYTIKVRRGEYYINNLSSTPQLIVSWASANTEMQLTAYFGAIIAVNNIKFYT